jgi:hypothetical protein
MLPDITGHEHTGPPSLQRDETIDRLYELMARLQECLMEAKDIRARLLEAREANVWPDLRFVFRRSTDVDRIQH